MLVRLTNEELAQNSSAEKERFEILQAQLTEVESRLGKLYDALETGEFKGGELAPRIQTLFEKKEQLQQAKADVEEVLSFNKVDITDPQIVRHYASDLRNLLAESCITEHKRAEEKAREAEALKELDRMRTELLSNVSHELRTPLATIKGYSTMLLDYDRRLRRDEKRKYLRFIDKASDRLVELID